MYVHRDLYEANCDWVYRNQTSFTQLRATARVLEDSLHTMQSTHKYSIQKIVQPKISRYDTKAQQFDQDEFCTYPVPRDDTWRRLRYSWGYMTLLPTLLSTLRMCGLDWIIRSKDGDEGIWPWASGALTHIDCLRVMCPVCSKQYLIQSYFKQELFYPQIYLINRKDEVFCSFAGANGCPSPDRRGEFQPLVCSQWHVGRQILQD